ncbi:dihydropteroate synthase [Candidatus Peribacteria bacterium]|nr:dihydropteroate synthase [Candidatus Peribacteria bacterium]
MKFVSGSPPLDLASRTGIVAILNVTPDSYYDGGKNLDPSHLLVSAKKALDGGADILEIGGESTGPDSKEVPLEVEMARVLPAVRALRTAFPHALLAVDTVKATVADAALHLGVAIINDVSAGRADLNMFSVIAHHRCPYIMMYSKDLSQRTTKANVQYDDVVFVVRRFLEERISVAMSSGILREQLILDPGLGHFISSDPAYSFEMLERLSELRDLGPILVSPSRKSFLAGPKNLPPSERLPATLEATLLAVQNGANFIRTHDPKETREALLRRSVQR